MPARFAADPGRHRLASFAGCDVARNAEARQQPCCSPGAALAGGGCAARLSRRSTRVATHRRQWPASSSCAARRQRGARAAERACSGFTSSSHCCSPLLLGWRVELSRAAAANLDRRRLHNAQWHACWPVGRLPRLRASLRGPGVVLVRGRTHAWDARAMPVVLAPLVIPSLLLMTACTRWRCSRARWHAGRLAWVHILVTLPFVSCTGAAWRSSTALRTTALALAVRAGFLVAREAPLPRHAGGGPAVGFAVSVAQYLPAVHRRRRLPRDHRSRDTRLWWAAPHRRGLRGVAGLLPLLGFALRLGRALQQNHLR